MELTTDIKAICADFDHLYEFFVRRSSAKRHSAVRYYFSVIVVKLVSVAMTLAYFRFSVRRIGFCIFFDYARVCSQPHRSALKAYVTLIGH